MFFRDEGDKLLPSRHIYALRLCVYCTRANMAGKLVSLSRAGAYVERSLLQPPAEIHGVLPPLSHSVPRGGALKLRTREFGRGGGGGGEMEGKGGGAPVWGLNERKRCIKNKWTGAMGGILLL